MYDRLAMGISGDMLTHVYLQTRRSMQLEGQGGARAKVDNVILIESTTKSNTESGGFVCQARWKVFGSVGHWGHIHERANQYVAQFRVEPIEGRWKITRMQVQQQQRLRSSAGR